MKLIVEENIMLIDGTGEPEEEIRRYDGFLADHPVDILVLGIGNNGHIGFNEPDKVFWAGTHLVELEEDTIKANAKKVVLIACWQASIRTAESKKINTVI